jgi:hypothetical protein
MELGMSVPFIGTESPIPSYAPLGQPKKAIAPRVSHRIMVGNLALPTLQACAASGTEWRRTLPLHDTVALELSAGIVLATMRHA